MGFAVAVVVVVLEQRALGPEEQREVDTGDLVGRSGSRWRWGLAGMGWVGRHGTD